MDYRNRRVTVMGLGHFGGGAAAAAWLAREDAAVTVTDLADAEDLADSLKRLQGVPLAAVHLGGHRDEDFRNAEMVVVNPAVRPGNRYVEIARSVGARLITELGLLIEHCPAPIVGVTGSNGKSTTAAMIDAILRADGRTCWLGGNIGGSLLERLEWVQPDDWVVLEISSFQLAWLGPGVPMPRVAVVTGCSPNHLDWHHDYAEYVATKQRILLNQKLDDLAVLNTHDDEVAGWGHLVRGRLITPMEPSEVPPLEVPGRHNRINAACAAAAAAGVGCGGEAIRRGLQAFCGLPQRLERFAVIDGRRFYNDSAATTPESTIAALHTLEGPIWLLAGGRDKGCDFGDLALTAVHRVAGAALFASVRDVLHGWITAHDSRFRCTRVETMAEALRWCWKHSRPGEAILLSPACPSGDQFLNYRRRGEQFVALVEALRTAHDHHERP